MSNGNGNIHEPVLEHEIQQHSVTRAENAAQKPGEGGVIKFYIGAYSGGMSTQITTLPDLPPFWSHIRDRILVSTVTAESRWAQAVGIAVMKTVTREWDVSGEVPATRLDKARKRVKTFLAPKQRSPLVTDYLLRDNGGWTEIVRPTSQPTGVIGLNYLDSARCMPTGDPRIPCVYWDRLGRPHEMRDYQVIRFVDMPDGSNPFGTGLCAARRAYNDIRQTAATQKFRYEKITGNNPKSIYFVSGVSPKQVQDLKLDHQQSQQANNIVAYGGVVIVPFIQREGIEVAEIPIASLPDGFDYKTEMQGTALAYANAIPGITYLDLMPMTGQRAGSSAQSQVVDDQSIQKDTFGANLVDALNDEDLYKIMPEQVRWYMKGNDLADRKRLADITLAFSNAAGILVSKCGFEPQMIQDWLIDNDILQPDNKSEQFSVLGANEPTGQVQQRTLKPVKPPAPTGDKPTPEASATKLKALADTVRALVANGAEIPDWQLQEAVQEAIGTEVVVVKTKEAQPQPVAEGDDMKPEDAMKLGIEMAGMMMSFAKDYANTVGTKELSAPSASPATTMENHVHLDKVMMDTPAALIEAITRAPAPEIKVEVAAPVVNYTPPAVNVDTSALADAMGALSVAVKAQKPPQVNIAGEHTETLQVVRDSDGLIDRIVRTVKPK